MISYNDLPNVAHDQWNGFTRHCFDFQGHRAWIVEPPVAAAEGRPWTWTMQWADAFVERTGVPDLLRRGYHHVTLEAFDTRCVDDSLQVFADFQSYLVENFGLAPKARLVGMSWGGFYSVRYATAYPENVLKIYLDAPLLELWHFYPDPHATPTENAAQIGPWAQLPPVGEADDDPRMPVNRAAALAAAKIPVLLLYGIEDTVVIPRYNSIPFIDRFVRAGGDIMVVPRCQNHHPHGEADTSRIAAFLA